MTDDRPAADRSDALLQELLAGQVLLADAGALLASSLDHRRTLQALASLAVPRLADWCSIEMKNDDGTTEQIAVAAHLDPVRVRWAKTVSAKYPTDLLAPGGVAEVLRTGKSLLLTEIPDAFLVTRAQDLEHLQLLRELKLRSCVIVPIAARGHIFGVLNLAYAESGRRYRQSDLTLAEQIGARAGVAVDNARLYARSQVLTNRARLLADVASTIAGAGLDLDAMSSAIVERIRATIGGVCTLALVEAKTQELRLLASGDGEATGREAARATHGDARRAMTGSLATQVIANGKAMLLNDCVRTGVARLDPVWGDQRARSPIDSIIAVPVSGARGTLAVLSLARRAPGPPFTHDDLVFVEDIARYVGLALDNALLYAEAQEAVLIRDEFLSIASHELRTPLTTMQLLVSGPELKDDKLRKLRRQLDKVNVLIGTLMDVSRLAAGKLQLERSSVDLSALVSDVISRFDDAAQRAQCTLDVQVQGATVGHWDPERIDQVVTNLVANGLKYGAGKPLRIDVSTTPEAVHLAVTDTGIGIAEADQERIFRKFERASSARSFAGLGLGLWISAQIVEAHGGRISVASTLGHGSRFLVELPRSTA